MGAMIVHDGNMLNEKGDVPITLRHTPWFGGEAEGFTAPPRAAIYRREVPQGRKQVRIKDEAIYDP